MKENPKQRLGLVHYQPGWTIQEMAIPQATSFTELLGQDLSMSCLV